MFCQSQAFSTEKSQILSGFFVKKTPKVFKKRQYFKICLRKSQIATLLLCILLLCYQSNKSGTATHA